MLDMNQVSLFAACVAACRVRSATRLESMDMVLLRRPLFTTWRGKSIATVNASQGLQWGAITRA